MTSENILQAAGILEVNFVPPRSSKIFIVAVSLLAVVGASTFAFTMVNLQNQRAMLLADIEKINATSRARVNETKTFSSANPERDRIRKQLFDAAALLSYPWNEIFNRIEGAADSEGVALLTFTHDQESGKTTLTIEALNVSSALKYVEKLNEGAALLARWQLSSYQLQTRSFPQTIRASIQSTGLGKP